MNQNEFDNVSKRIEITTLGGGCFWCLEAVFSDVKGIEKVEPGYSGGTSSNPTYNQVSTGNTGHAEVIQITYNANIISFREILEIFFAIHDPTTLNRQGADVGSQYRSIIFYHNDEQKSISEKMIKELEKAKIWTNRIVTKIEPFKAFYKAEDYHKDYYKRNPEQAYCKLVIRPKIVKLYKKYGDRTQKKLEIN